MVLTLLVAWAAPPSDSDDPAVSEEIVVYGELRVDQAREAVIQRLEEAGYERRVEKDGAVVMRHSAAWKGDVWLHEDGWMRIKRQPVQLRAPRTPFGKENSPGAWMGCVLYPFACVRTGGQTVGRRKFMAVETRTASAIDPLVSEWGDRVADLSVDRKAEALPARLDALWRDGTPITDDPDAPVLQTMEARRKAIFDFWASRTGNEWGERVRATIEAFIRGEVQASEHPFTDDELAFLNATSHAGRPLDLTRRRDRDR